MPILTSALPQITPGDFKLIAAPFTPMKSNGSLNLSVIETYAEKLYRDGVTGVFICGTTGEGFSLTLDERQRVAEAWRSAIGDRMSPIVHVGHCCNQDAMQLAHHAEQLAADGIASIGPIFFTPNTPQTLIETFQLIAAAAPQTPFYAYHMPSMSRVQFPASSWILEMSAHIPSFRGLKFTHEDLEDFRACVTKGNGTLEMFFGRDELFLSGLNMGAQAAVGSTFNFAAPLYLRIAQAHSEKIGGSVSSTGALHTSDQPHDFGGWAFGYQGNTLYDRNRMRPSAPPAEVSYPNAIHNIAARSRGIELLRQYRQ